MVCIEYEKHYERHFCLLLAQDSHAGHAFLHDFCMTIPYGALVAAGGLVSLFFGASSLGMQVAGAGAVVCASSVCSLKSWKAGGSSTLFTLASAGTIGAFA
jgi:hypothetical protein